MSVEVNIGERTANVEMIKRDGNNVRVSVDNKEYDIDIIEVEKGVYSILYENNSYDIALKEGDTSKQYTVNSFFSIYDLEIIDAESRYMKSRKGSDLDDESFISSPMPGKVVKILVKEGDTVPPDTTVVIVSAMKMESEYKVKKERLIKEIKVKEGDTVDGNQPLIMIE